MLLTAQFYCHINFLILYTTIGSQCNFFHSVLNELFEFKLFVVPILIDHKYLHEIIEFIGAFQKNIGQLKLCNRYQSETNRAYGEFKVFALFRLNGPELRIEKYIFFVPVYNQRSKFGVKMKFLP